MKVVRYAPTEKINPGKVLQSGQTYTVKAVHFSPLTGVMFALVEFDHSNRFPANHFRALNGKSADKVRALPGTETFKLYGERLFYLAGLSNTDGVELVMLRECKAPVLHQKPLPYVDFIHV